MSDEKMFTQEEAKLGAEIAEAFNSLALKFQEAGVSGRLICCAMAGILAKTNITPTMYAYLYDTAQETM